MAEPPQPSIEEARLGADATAFRLDSRHENRVAAARLAAGASRELTLFSRDLEPAVYDQSDFLEAVTRLALSSRHARIRVLVVDPRRMIKEGHRLVELARRLSTYVHIRQVHSDYQDHAEAFLIADGRGVLHRALASRYEGNADFNNPLLARRLGQFFDEVWERSAPIPDLRRLHV